MRIHPKVGGFASIVVGLSLMLWTQAGGAVGQQYTDVSGAGASKGGSQSGALAFTGSSSSTLVVVLGVAFVVVGAAVLLRLRMRASHADKTS